jgi:hypothetical protein
MPTLQRTIAAVWRRIHSVDEGAVAYCGILLPVDSIGYRSLYATHVLLFHL